MSITPEALERHREPRGMSLTAYRQLREWGLGIEHIRGITELMGQYRDAYTGAVGKVARIQTVYRGVDPRMGVEERIFVPGMCGGDSDQPVQCGDIAQRFFVDLANSGILGHLQLPTSEVPHMEMVVGNSRTHFNHDGLNHVWCTLNGEVLLDPSFQEVVPFVESGYTTGYVAERLNRGGRKLTQWSSTLVARLDPVPNLQARAIAKDWHTHDDIPVGLSEDRQLAFAARFVSFFAEVHPYVSALHANGRDFGVFVRNPYNYGDLTDDFTTGGMKLTAEQRDEVEAMLDSLSHCDVFPLDTYPDDIHHQVSCQIEA